MATIDLTEKTTIYHKWETDTVTGILSVIFLVPNPIITDPDIEVGRVQIEPAKARALVESLRAIGRTIYPDTDTAQLYQHRTHYDNQTVTAKVELYEAV
jgi:hypothetical protein